MTLRDRINKLLFSKDPNAAYFAHACALFDIKETNEVHYMAICPDNNKISLYYNANNIKKLDDKMLSLVIIHEFMHIILEHPLRENKKYSHAFNNLCADLAINSFIPEVSKIGMVVPGIDEFKDISKGLSYEEYINILSKKIKVIKTKFKDDDFRKKHSKYTKETFQNIKDLLKNIDSNGLDNKIKNKIYQFINTLSKWDVQVSKWIYSKMSSQEEYSKKRYNRRYFKYFGVIPGKKTKHNYNLLIAIDCSGSIDNHTLSKFINLINKLTCYKIIITFNTDIIKVYYNKINNMSIKKGGGTKYECIIKYADTNKIKNIVVLTDLLGIPPTGAKNKNILWVSSRPLAGNIYKHLWSKNHIVNI